LTSFTDIYPLSFGIFQVDAQGLFKAFASRIKMINAARRHVLGSLAIEILMVRNTALVVGTERSPQASAAVIAL
jgi:hypothetical protein